MYLWLVGLCKFLMVVKFLGFVIVLGSNIEGRRFFGRSKKSSYRGSSIWYCFKIFLIVGIVLNIVFKVELCVVLIFNLDLVFKFVF